MPENNLFAIKKRIVAARQTRKITSAMELVASSRLHRAKLLLAGLKGWAMHMHEAARCLPDSFFEPLGGFDGEDKGAYILFGGSKGLSGSYGANLFQYAAPVVEGQVIIAIGSATKAAFPDAHSAFADDAPSMESAAAIATAVKALYESRAVSAVYTVFMRGAEQVRERLLPLVRADEHTDRVLAEPSQRALFPALYDAYLETVVYEAHLHAFIAEQIARVSAMDSATQNADKIIDELQSTYNRIRQSNITQEIIMISNAGRGGGA